MGQPIPQIPGLEYLTQVSEPTRRRLDHPRARGENRQDQVMLHTATEVPQLWIGPDLADLGRPDGTGLIGLRPGQTSAHPLREVMDVQLAAGHSR